MTKKLIKDFGTSSFVQSGGMIGGGGGGSGGAVDLYTTLNPQNTTIGDYSTPSSAASSSVAAPVTSGTTQLTYTASCSTTYNGMSFTIPSSMNGKNIYRAGIKTARNNSSSWNWTLGMRLKRGGTTVGTFQTTISKSTIPVEFSGMNGSNMTWVYFDVDTSDPSVGFLCATGDNLELYWISGSGTQIIYSATCAYNHTIDDQIQYIASHLVDNTISNESVARTQQGVGEWLSFDIGTSSERQGVALYLDSGNTETEFKIQTSPDNVNWTTVRTILTTKLTASAWNYITFNVATWEYCRILGSSGASKIVSFTEAKSLAGDLNDNHGHQIIDPDDTSLGLNGLEP